MVQTKYDVPVRRTHKGNRICLYHFISFTLKITCEICFWYCQGNQKTEDIFINGKLTPPHHYKFFFPCIVIFIHIYFCKRKHFSYHFTVSYYSVSKTGICYSLYSKSSQGFIPKCFWN